MFKRRKPLSLIQKAKELIWPSMGWKRAAEYIKHRVLRMPDSNHKIALGLAFGAGVSFSPIMTTHIFQAGFLAYIFRANIPASLVGTAFGNPWTFPFIWWASITLGSNIFNLLGLPAQSTIPKDFDLPMLWDMVTTDPMRVALPMLVGGYILCAATIAIAYPIYFTLIKGARHARQKARKAKAIKEQKQ